MRDPSALSLIDETESCEADVIRRGEVENTKQQSWVNEQ